MTWDRIQRAHRLRKGKELTVDFDPETVNAQAGYTATTGDAGIAGGYVVVYKPDSHGYYVDPAAYTAFLSIVKMLRPHKIVNLGDGLDAGGVFSSHGSTYLRELDYSYDADCAAQNAQLDEELKYCREYVYISGNHENRIEKWCAKMLGNKRDAQATCDAISPDVRLKLKERGIKYIRTDQTYDGLSVPGTIKIGKLHAQHGYSIAKHAAASHLGDFNECLVFGHTHRMQQHATRTIRSEAIAAWSPGCISLLQSYWLHSKPTAWTQGVGVAFFERDGRFLYLNVPIINGWSGLEALISTIRPQHLFG